MDKKRTQRIIGVLAVAGLVIIALPLFGKNDLPPPAPQQVADNTTIDQSNPNEAVITSSMASDIAANSESSEDYTNKVLSDHPPTIKPSKTQLVPPVLKKVGPNINNAIEDSSKSTNNPIDDSPKWKSATLLEPKLNSEQKINEPVKNSVMAINSETKHVLNKHVLASNVVPNKAGWAIQMGSFKVKANAQRLAEKLRAKGYVAFTREIKTAKSTQTRVYIGPESHQITAYKLSGKVEQELNLHGILINYKPTDT